MDDENNPHPEKNTGNIARQTLTVPGVQFVQNYRYDSLYRLTSAKETADESVTWSQDFQYDRYGNRTNIGEAINGQRTTRTTPQIDPNTNRFTDLTTFAYDKNGNITRDVDQVTNELRTFVFDGDNKQSEIKDANGQTIGKYFYDGEGKRVKKFIFATNETTVFVYSSGKLIAEYTTAIPSAQPAISYTATDMLGSPRVITNELGNVVSRRDFMPFGEDVPTEAGDRAAVQDVLTIAEADGNGNLRTTALNYQVSDNIRQRFTGYQKDTETSLDFAEARMYESRYGRFTAVDPLLTSGKSANPQSFNRYVYVGGNPLARIDPSGKDWYFLDGHFRWSTDNKYFTPGIGEFLNPTSVNGWTKIELDSNNEYRYWVDSTTPGVAQEVILSDTFQITTGGHWSWGSEKIIDPVAHNAYLMERAETHRLISEMFGAINDNRDQNDALRPLTDNQTGSPPQIGYVFDKMKPNSEGKPELGETSRTLGAASKDIKFAPNGWALPGNGKSVASSPFSIPAFKRDQLFCFQCKSLGSNLQVGMDKENPSHLFLQPARPLPVKDFVTSLQGTQKFWFPIDETDNR